MWKVTSFVDLVARERKNVGPREVTPINSLVAVIPSINVCLFGETAASPSLESFLDHVPPPLNRYDVVHQVKYGS